MATDIEKTKAQINGYLDQIAVLQTQMDAANEEVKVAYAALDNVKKQIDKVKTDLDLAMRRAGLLPED